MGSKKPSTAGNKHMEHFYMSSSRGLTGQQSSIFSPVLQNMHKKQSAYKANDVMPAQTLKINHAVRAKPTKVVGRRQEHGLRSSPSKHEALITPVLAGSHQQQVQV